MNRIEEIRQWLAAARPGPWEVQGDEKSRYMFDYGYGGFLICGEDEMLVLSKYLVQLPDVAAFLAEYPDFDLIANAPADIAFLLAEVEQWRARCESIAAANAELLQANASLIRQNARLTGALEELDRAHGHIDELAGRPLLAEVAE